MKEFQGKRRWRRLVYSLPVCLLLALLIVLSAKSTYQLYEKRRLADHEQQLALEEVARLRARQAQLAEEVAKLSTARGVEAAIRENFNVVKPGEKVITLVKNESTAATDSPLLLPSRSWWRVIIEWFKV